MVYRITRYKREYCQKIQQIFENGGTLSDFCVAINETRRVVYAWAEKYPEFRKSYEIAREKAKIARDKKLNDNMYYHHDEPNFNAQLYYQTTRMRFKDLECESLNDKIFEKNKNLLQTLSTVMTLVASGRIDSAQANSLTKLIDSCVKVREQETILKKLESLEKIAKNTITHAKAEVYDAIAEQESEDADSTTE